jgi:cytidylate kinase
MEVVAKQKGITPEEARKIIETKEKNRAEYYNYYTGKQWGMAMSYDFCIDASLLGIEDTEQIIADFVRRRFHLPSKQMQSK